MFKDKPPVTSYPNGGATVYSTTPALNWYITTGTTDHTWEVQIKTAAAADWSTPVHTSGPLGDVRTYSPPAGVLAGGGSYVWRALVKTDGAVVGVSDQAAFEIVGGGGAPVPTASWPVGGATVYSLQPALNWYTSGGSATSFEVELINTTAGESFDGAAEFTTTDRSVDLSAQNVTLASGADYEWRVRSMDATTTSAWSATASFSTVAVAAVTAPTPSYPTGGALLYSTDARLSWYLGTAATGLSYVVTLTPDGGAPVVYPATNALFLDVTGLTPGADYTWSVSASDGSTSAASVDATFSVFQAVAAGAGTAVASWPVAPGGTAPTVRTRKPTLSWWVDGRRSALSGFQVEWSTDATFATVEKSRRVNDPNAASLEIAPALDWATTYYWRVGAIAQVRARQPCGARARLRRSG